VLQCLVMERLGENLSSVLKGVVTKLAAVGHARSMLSALRQLHEHGFIHRDIKPVRIPLAAIRLTSIGRPIF